MHIVECRGDVAHQRHEEKGDLQNIFLDEVEAPDKLVVPSDMVQAQEKGENPEKDSDANDLSHCVNTCFEGDRSVSVFPRAPGAGV